MGRCCGRVSEPGSVIARVVRVTGGFEDAEIDIAAALFGALYPDRCIVDVGAKVGIEDDRNLLGRVGERGRLGGPLAGMAARRWSQISFIGSKTACNGEPASISSGSPRSKRRRMLLNLRTTPRARSGS